MSKVPLSYFAVEEDSDSEASQIRYKHSTTTVEDYEKNVKDLRTRIHIMSKLEQDVYLFNRERGNEARRLTRYKKKWGELMEALK